MVLIQWLTDHWSWPPCPSMWLTTLLVLQASGDPTSGGAVAVPTSSTVLASPGLELTAGGGKVMKAGLPRIAVSPYPSPAEMLALKQSTLLTGGGGGALPIATLQVRVHFLSTLFFLCKTLGTREVVLSYNY